MNAPLPSAEQFIRSLHALSGPDLATFSARVTFGPRGEASMGAHMLMIETAGELRFGRTRWKQLSSEATAAYLASPEHRQRDEDWRKEAQARLAIRRMEDAERQRQGEFTSEAAMFDQAREAEGHH
jgi:hypothetical protein